LLLLEQLINTVSLLISYIGSRGHDTTGIREQCQHHQVPLRCSALLLHRSKIVFSRLTPHIN